MSTSRYDRQDQVCNAQAFTATAVSADSKDMSAAGIDLSVNRRLGYEIQVKADPVSNATYEFQAIQADDAALTTNVEVIGSSGAGITSASLPKKTIITVDIRKGSMTRRYHGIKVIQTGGSSPSLTIDAYMCPIDEVKSFKPVARPSGQVPSYTP